jgi:hypothetical protein
MASERQTDATIAQVETPKGAEPHGRSRPIPAACLASASHFGAVRVGGSRRQKGAWPSRFGEASATPETAGPLHRRLRLRSTTNDRDSSRQQLRFRPAAPPRGCTESDLRLGIGEARGIRLPFMTTGRLEQSGSAAPKGLSRRGDGTQPSPSDESPGNRMRSRAHRTEGAAACNGTRRNGRPKGTTTSHCGYTL